MIYESPIALDILNEFVERSLASEQSLEDLAENELHELVDLLDECIICGHYCYSGNVVCEDCNRFIDVLGEFEERSCFRCGESSNNKFAAMAESAAKHDPECTPKPKPSPGQRVLPHQYPAGKAASAVVPVQRVKRTRRRHIVDTVRATKSQLTLGVLL
jgi:hypothetical protein